jgi:hypothetical protein
MEHCYSPEGFEGLQGIIVFMSYQFSTFVAGKNNNCKERKQIKSLF